MKLTLTVFQPGYVYRFGSELTQFIGFYCFVRIDGGWKFVLPRPRSRVEKNLIFISEFPRCAGGESSISFSRLRCKVVVPNILLI